MPIVDYKDSVTGDVFEEYIRTTDIPETIINEKTGNKANRIWSGRVGFEFKGSGFYETDYKKKGL